MLMFNHMAAQQGIEVVSYESSAEGRLEIGPDGMKVTEITVRPEIVIAAGQDVGAAVGLMHKAHAMCPVGRSICPEVHIEPEIREAGA